MIFMSSRFLSLLLEFENCFYTSAFPCKNTKILLTCKNFHLSHIQYPHRHYHIFWGKFLPSFYNFLLIFSHILLHELEGKLNNVIFEVFGWVVTFSWHNCHFLQNIIFNTNFLYEFKKSFKWINVLTPVTKFMKFLLEMLHFAFFLNE